MDDDIFDYDQGKLMHNIASSGQKSVRQYETMSDNATQCQTMTHNDKQ